MSEDKPLNELNATEIAAGVAQGRFTGEAVTTACLEHIAKREPVLGAWAWLDPRRAQAQARAPVAEVEAGPLFGVPVGIKDVFDTLDAPTQMGSPIYAQHQPPGDAAAVACLRAAGAVILGKTVTCEFAGMTPGKTTNPHDPARTPGGSSSGSAAAVADFGVPVALGTQTGGSILRPASFCGIVGFKPSFGTISRTGLKLAAESLDTIGMLARTVDDIELLFNVFTGAPANTPAAEAEAPRIGLCRTHVWERAEPDTVAAVENAASMFRSAGATIAEVDLPEEFAGLTDARAVINDVERARAMAFEWHHHRKLISAELTATVQRGLETSHETYVEALRLCERLRGRLGEVFGDCDVLLVPCVNGVAPEGLDSTGDPEFQGIWTALHVPTISLPTHQNDAGLPVGVQLVGRSYDDRQLLEIARWVMARAGV